MTLGELRARTIARLDEILSGRYYTQGEVTTALNTAQRLFAFTTLSVEAQGPLPLTGGEPWYRLLDTFPLLTVVLRVRVASGAKVRPATLAWLQARDRDWQSAPGQPTHYAVSGCELFAVYPRPIGAGTSLEVTYAHTPMEMAADGDVPAIAEEYHPALVDGAIPFLRLKEGAQELSGAMTHFERYLAAIRQCAEAVRTRNKARGYDAMPVELRDADVRKLLAIPQRDAR